jgi:hypothetical protein
MIFNQTGRTPKYVKEHALPAPIERAGSSSFGDFTIGMVKVIVPHYRNRYSS